MFCIVNQKKKPIPSPPIPIIQKKLFCFTKIPFMEKNIIDKKFIEQNRSPLAYFYIEYEVNEKDDFICLKCELSSKFKNDFYIYIYL